MKLKKNVLLLVIISSFLESIGIPIGGWNLHIYQIALVLAILVLAANFGTTMQTKLNTAVYWLLLLLVCLFVSAFLSDYIQTAFKGSILITLYSATTVVVYLLAKGNQELIDYLIEKLIFFGAISAIIVTLSYFLFTYFGIDYLGAEINYLQSYSDDIGTGTVTRAYGLYSNATTGGVTIISISMLLVTQLLFKVKKVNFKNTIILLIFLFGANATYTRGFIVGAVFGFIILILFYGLYNATLKKAFTIFFVASVFFALFILIIGFFAKSNEVIFNMFSKFGAIFDLESGTGLYRIEVWLHLINDFFDNPFFGTGILSYQATFHKDGNAENFLLELLSGAGFFALLSFLSLNYSMIVKTLKLVKENPHNPLLISSIGIATCSTCLFFGYTTNPGYWTNIPWLIAGLLLASITSNNLKIPQMKKADAAV